MNAEVSYIGDVLIRDGVIEAVGTSLKVGTKP